ncbi:MAG TPA: hypothetical protein PK402_03780 [Tepidisphaeraceae bacterium]|nr:hypothetical protein [Tepidisphaeraceae bacterium]
MKRNVISILIVVNTLLVGLLIYRMISPNTAIAQVKQPGNYLLIDGEANGVSSDLVYVLDMANGELSALVPNQNSERLEAMPPVNLNQIFDNAMQNKAPDGKQK